MNNYVGNSFKSKEDQIREQARKQSKVTHGQVLSELPNTEGWFMKALHYFISEDFTWKGLFDYILADVLKPTVRSTTLNILKSSAEIAVNGKATKSTGTNNNVQYSKVSYQSGAVVPASQNTTRSSGVGYEPIKFVERGDAEAVLNSMRELVAAYGNVSVSEMFDLAGLTIDYTWNKYGWTNLDGADISRKQINGAFIYEILLPKATPIQ